MTHPRLHARANPDKPAVVMTDGSPGLSYGELEDRANRGAHLLRELGIGQGETIAYWLPNCPEVFEVYWAGQRAGCYITPIATALTAEEADYIIGNSGARLLVADSAIPGLAALPARPGVTVMTREEWRAALDRQPQGQIADEAPGFHMVYSSGTTGRPKGIRLPLPEGEVTASHQLAEQIGGRYGLGPDDTYLSPAPLYHTAPLAYTTAAHRLGATVVVMPKFDAEEALKAIQDHRVTMTQMVPTMFVRMLKLSETVRKSYDLSSLRHVVHAAAPCPVPVKHAMIEWLGPIVFEYYGGSEGNGSTAITSEEWLRKPGSVGRASWGTIHICNDAGNELSAGEQGIVYFEGGWDFKYLGDEEKTRDARNPRHPTWSTLGDVGYLDEDGYLFLTDRKSYMIISGGVNIYPQEVENLLITHPRVADAAVIGVPNPDFGEEVKAVVQPLDPADATPAFAAELIAFCKEHLSPIKCPRSVDFDPALPRLDNGKLYKRLIKDRYWKKD
ncbi:acyl-CoA synthetase [Novosphingobium sp.]|uniref:acyl-CoA synthetase n=1 Tax=Novosphingobium sp. TaxID=1874826 RepID=UPI001EB58767|nr:acyl-CoA synthetase [Novosphingobium sp.]MBK9009693.1 acyl-CoA synthetase [Novosphingobium sp.]